jgi:hypothetical protein
MGEGTDRVDIAAHDGHRDTDAPGPRETAQGLGEEIAAVRGELDVLVAELDRRRHEALDLRLHIRRHAPGIALTAIAFVGAAAAFVWVGAWRARRRQRLVARAGRLRLAVSRLMEHPERVASEPTIPGKIMTAAANAAVAAVIKKTLERFLAEAMARPRPARHRSIPETSGDSVYRMDRPAQGAAD